MNVDRGSWATRLAGNGGVKLHLVGMSILGGYEARDVSEIDGGLVSDRQVSSSVICDQEQESHMNYCNGIIIIT